MSTVGPCVINYHVSWVQPVHYLTLCQNQIDQKISLNSAVTAFEIAQKSDKLLKCGGRLQIWRMKWGLAKIKNEWKVVFGVSH